MHLPNMVAGVDFVESCCSRMQPNLRWSSPRGGRHMKRVPGTKPRVALLRLARQATRRC